MSWARMTWASVGEAGVVSSGSVSVGMGISRSPGSTVLSTGFQVTSGSVAGSVPVSCGGLVLG